MPAPPAPAPEEEEEPTPATLPATDADGVEAQPMCTFCPSGLVDASTPLPSNATCGSALSYAETLVMGEANCTLVQMAQAVCCPKASTMPATDGPVRRRRTLKTAAHRRLQDAVAVTTEAEVDPNAIVEIVSVQFLEFDTSGDLTVINQDDSYADVSLSNGDRLKFMSASSFLDTSIPLEDQTSSPALVPGGASLILYGKKADGTVVRNRFFWMYDMNCGRENSPVNVGDEIGWVKVAETANAWPAFCPALPDGSPTISPRTNEPTLVPSKSPTLKPSASPEMSMSMVTTASPTVRSSSITPPSGGGGLPPAFSKSNKQPKTPKPAKADKESSHDAKSGKSSKSSKSAKHAKTSRDMQGKSGKELLTHDGVNAMGRVTGFDVERANGVERSVYSGVGLMMSLVACVILLARQ